MTTRSALRKVLPLLALGLLFSRAPCFAQARHEAPEPEHTIWVKFASEPTSVDLYAPGRDEQTPGQKIGTTPCTVAVDLTWGRKWMRRRWNKIRVWSPSDVARATMLANSNYDLTVSFIAQKDGYQAQTIRSKVTTLEFPGRDWSGQARWPSEQTVEFELSPSGASRDASPGAVRRRPARRVILAGPGGEGPTVPGTLSVSANVDGAVVLIDDTQVGPAPVQLVLQEGRHVVRLQKAGFQPLRKEIHVTGDTEVTYRAVLVPETE